MEWEIVEEYIPPRPADPRDKPTHEVTNRHWLSVYPDTDGSPWRGGGDEDGELYYTVFHECAYEDFGGYWHPSCTLQFEIDNIGSDVFDPEGDYWPNPPFYSVEINHVYNVYRSYMGDYDVESYVEKVDEA